MLATVLEILRRSIRRFGRGGECEDPLGRQWRTAMVCSVKGERVRSLRVARAASGQVVLPPDGPGRDDGSNRADSTVIAMLPKQYYLVRTLTIPNADPDETRAMLSLEAVTPLQPEFGSAEMGYRKLKDVDGGQSQYEVYIARAHDVSQYLHKFEKAGLSPSIVLPSVVAWRYYFAGRDEDFRVCLAGQSGDAATEVAIRLADGSAAVRTVSPGTGDGSAEDLRFVRECVRTARAAIPGGRGTVGVGLIGADATIDPARIGEDVRCVAAISREQLPDGVDPSAIEPLALMAALALSQIPVEVFSTADVTPRRVVIARQRSKLWRRLVATVGLVFLALAVTLAAGKIAVARYDRACAHLDVEIGQIRTIGETVEQKLTQFIAIREMQVSRGYLHDVMAGLHEATPEGVSYNQVDLTGDREVRIGGQATSASLPFLLPERFEKSGFFEQVVLGGVGQSSKGAGSITQFELQCTLRGRRDR
jgi:hypothetical protein